MKRLLFVCILVLAVLFSCAEDKSEVVAEVGPEKITKESFEISFALDPHYALRTPLRKARQSQVDYLVREKYFQLAARKADLEKDSLIQRRLGYIREQEVVKGYIRKHFLDKIEITPEEQRRALSKFDTKVRVQHIFFSDCETAREAKKEIDGGKIFETVAAKYSKVPSLSASGGDLGYLGYGDLDPNLEDRVFNLKIGEISEPVESAYGYHLLKVSDVQLNENLSQVSLAYKLQLINDILRNRKADKLIRDHIRSLSGNRKIKVNNHILDVLVQATRKTMAGRYNQPNLLKPPIKSGDLDSIQVSVGDVLDSTLMEFGEREIKVRDFIDRLKTMPPFHRPYLRTRNRMIQTLIDMTRTDLLLTEALQEGIDKNSTVRDQIKEYKEKMLADEFSARYYSDYFKEYQPDEWQRYHKLLETVKAENRSVVYEKKLFAGIQNPDSVMAPPPIPVFVKNRYVW